MVNLSQGLETMREAAQHVCERILEKRSDIIAIYIIGSVARGDIHQKSDVDLIVLIEQGDFKEERFKELSCNFDICYFPLELWKEELYYSWGSEWEVEASSIVDSLILYDPKRLVERTKEEFATYPEEKRRKGIRNIYDQMIKFSQAVWHHYVNNNYDIESIFSKFYAMQALKILFPLNKVYLKDDKDIFKQVEKLQEKPPSYLQKCSSLFSFKSQNVNYDEATWIINTVSETKRVIETKISSIDHSLLRSLDSLSN